MKRKHDRHSMLSVDKLNAPQFPIVEGLWCVEVKVPADLEYVYALQGFIGFLTNYWTYLGTVEERKTRADLWLEAYTATDWEGCMDCETLQDCIEPLLEAQNAQFKAMLNQSKYGTEATPGVPMTTEQREEDLAAGTNPGCDLDVTWAQSQQVVTYMNAMIEQALQAAEAATNTTEFMQAVAGLPGLDEIGADALAGYVQMMQEAIAENYLAAYSPEYEVDAQCAVFCVAQDDCTITPEKIYQIFYDRVTGVFGTPVEAINTLIDLFGYLVGQPIDGSTVADVMMMVVSGGGVLANLFLGDVGVVPMKALLALAVNDANNDWLFQCTCPNIWEYDADLATILTWTDYVLSDAGLPDTSGWISNPASSFNGTAIFGIATSAPFECLTVQPYITALMDGDQNRVVVGDLPLAFAVDYDMTGLTDVVVPVNETIDGLAIGYTPNDTGSGYPNFPGATYRVKVRGRGYQPPELGG